MFQKYPDLRSVMADEPPGEKAHRLFEKAMEEYSFKGLKLHPVGNLCHPGGPETIDMIRLATRYKAPTLFHCGDEELTLPLQIAQAAEACPEATIILGHCGGYFHVEDAIRVAERYPNIVLETRMPYPRLIKEAVERGAHALYASEARARPDNRGTQGQNVG
jgi:predicted TIM-barrel fold metal-dependent hydrolase